MLAIVARAPPEHADDFGQEGLTDDGDRLGYRFRSRVAK